MPETGNVISALQDALKCMMHSDVFSMWVSEITEHMLIPQGFGCQPEKLPNDVSLPLPCTGPSMSGRIESAADMVLDNYNGNLEELRKAAGKDPEKEMKLIREFKGVGETAVNIFCREVQLLWDELFPFADQSTLETLSHHGISCSSAQEVADLVGNDRCARFGTSAKSFLCICLCQSASSLMLARERSGLWPSMTFLQLTSGNRLTWMTMTGVPAFLV